MTALPQVPLADPARDIASYRKEILAAVARVIETGPYILGPEVQAFEAEMAERLQVAGAAGVASGTDALALGLLGLGVGAGDEVVTVSHTAGPTVAAIRMIGAVPVLVDIEPDTYTIDPKAFEGAIGPKTKAVISVHLYGHPADMPRVTEIARSHGVHVLEDCAQAQGATLEGKPVGSFGDAAAFSFYPTKIMGALGDGGLVAAKQKDTTERIFSLRTYGWRKPQFSEDPHGRCSRLDPIQAAILRTRLVHVETEITHRRALAQVYANAFKDLPLILPAERPGARHVYHLYVIRCDKRDALRSHLERAGIMTGLHYPYPVHKQPGLFEGARLGGALPVTERIVADLLTLPLFPSLHDMEQRRVIHAVRDFFGGQE